MELERVVMSASSDTGKETQAMNAQKFRKKPVVIEAVQHGGSSSHVAALRKWIEGGEYHEPGVTTRDFRDLEIVTLEGTMRALPGDWVIRGVKGEFYPCKPDIFDATYEPLGVSDGG